MTSLSLIMGRSGVLILFLFAAVAAGASSAALLAAVGAEDAIETSPEGSRKVLNEHERNGLIATLVRASPDYRTSSISADILRNQLQGMNNAELLRKHSEMPGEVDNELDRFSAPGTSGGHQAVVEEAERVVADAEKMLRDMKRLSNVDEQQLATAELSVSPDYVDYLRSLAPIPKLVHVVWPDKDVVHSNLEMVKQGIYRIVELNPSWTLLVHDDDDVDRTIRNSTLLSVEDKRILEHAHPVERADVFRLHIMYTHGGLYTDIDRVMNVHYHNVLPHGARLVLPTNYDSNFMQDNFGSSRGNRLFKCMLDQQSMLRSKMERRRGWLSTGSIMRLGPELFNRQISLALFGKEDASRNSEMADVRRALDRTRPVIVTRKDEWCDGLFITPYDGCKAVSRNGLYKAYGIKSWSGAVQERWKEEERDAADAEKILRGTKLEQCFQDLTLPDGCARAVAARGRRNLRDVASPQEPPAGGSMQVPVSEYSEIQTIHDVPHAYYRRCEIDADTDTRAFSYHDSGSHSLRELNIDDGHGMYQHRSTHFLPTAAVTFCIPDGIVVDSSLGGPSTRRGLRFLDDNSNDAPPPIYFKQTKMHFVNLHQFANWLQPGRQQFAKRPAATTGSLMHSPISMVDYPGMGIQLSAWTGFKYNHFVYDTFVRLALVYDRITTADAVQDPGGLWRNAKLIVSLGTDAKSSTVDNLKPGVRFVFDRLNLTSRLVANTGWLKIAKSTPRFEYLVMPDADPIYHCSKYGFTRYNQDEAVFPQGSLLPLQRALGVLDPSVPRDLIVFAGRKIGTQRAVDKIREEEIIAALKDLLDERDLNDYLHVHRFHHKGDTLADFELFRRAWIVVGPHGGQLWNVAFSKPGTQLIEFSSFADSFINADCRDCGFALANAAAHEYHIVEVQHANFTETRGLMPRVDHVVDTISGFLTRNDIAIRRSRK